MAYWNGPMSKSGSQGSAWEHVIREQGDLRNDWRPLQRKEFQSRLCFLPLFGFPAFFFEKNTGTETRKMWGPPFPLCRSEHRGPGLLLLLLMFSSILTFAVVAHPPVAVFAFALVRARRVVAGGVAAAVALTWRALVHIWNKQNNIQLRSASVKKKRKAPDITVD